MGRTGHPALIVGISALAVLVADTAVVLTHGQGPVAHAQTVLGPLRNAQVITATGDTHSAMAGAVVGPGEVVITGHRGDAELLTRGRITLLGPDAALAVVDGGHQQLRTGTAVIDAQQGPGLSLDLATDLVSVPAGSATEVDRSVSVRIGSLSGPASVTNSSGSRLTVGALWQAVLNGDALPSAPTPLQLSDSADEARAVPALVSDDLAIKTLARGIDTTGASTVTAVETAWSGTVLPASAGLSRSERVLPAVIADATAPAGGTEQQRYNEVVGWRDDGGSWGVVVHLLDSRAAAVVDALHALQNFVPTGTVAVVALPPLGPVAIGGAPGGQRGNHGGPPGSTPPPSTTPPSTPPPGGGSTPPPGPTPTVGLVGVVVNALGNVLHSLLAILPLKAAKTATTRSSDRKAVAQQRSSHAGQKSLAPNSNPQRSVPQESGPQKPNPSTPTPTPSPGLSGLLGGVLGILSPL